MIKSKNNNNKNSSTSNNKSKTNNKRKHMDDNNNNNNAKDKRATTIYNKKQIINMQPQIFKKIFMPNIPTIITSRSDVFTKDNIDFLFQHLPDQAFKTFFTSNVNTWMKPTNNNHNTNLVTTLINQKNSIEQQWSNLPKDIIGCIVPFTPTSDFTHILQVNKHWKNKIYNHAYMWQNLWYSNVKTKYHCGIGKSGTSTHKRITKLSINLAISSSHIFKMKFQDIQILQITVNPKLEWQKNILRKLVQHLSSLQQVWLTIFKIIHCFDDVLNILSNVKITRLSFNCPRCPYFNDNVKSDRNIMPYLKYIEYLELKYVQFNNKNYRYASEVNEEHLRLKDLKPFMNQLKSLKITAISHAYTSNKDLHNLEFKKTFAQLNKPFELSIMYPNIMQQSNIFKYTTIPNNATTLNIISNECTIDYFKSLNICSFVKHLNIILRHQKTAKNPEWFKALNIAFPNIHTLSINIHKKVIGSKSAHKHVLQRLYELQTMNLNLKCIEIIGGVKLDLNYCIENQRKRVHSLLCYR